MRLPELISHTTNVNVRATSASATDRLSRVRIHGAHIRSQAFKNGPKSCVVLLPKPHQNGPKVGEHALHLA